MFIEDKDKEPIITFGFKISDENIRSEIYDSNNQLINERVLKTCDENLNEIKNGNIDINNYTCFVNNKFFVSNSTNHLIKFHLIIKNLSYINDDNLSYFYDVGYTTRYSKYIKIINYETIKEILGIKSKNQVESKFLEDYEDSSKLKENKTNEFLGSFRLSLSKKKKCFLELIQMLLL